MRTHLSGYTRFGNRWFASAPLSGSKPWIIWSDDLGKTSTLAPQGNLSQSIGNKTHWTSFFSYKGNLFACAGADKGLTLRYTGIEHDPFELHANKVDLWGGNRQHFRSVWKATEFKGNLFIIRGSNSGYVAVKCKPVLTSGRYGDYSTG